MREASAPQTATDQDIALTLEAFRVSPTQARVTLCFEEPEADRQWTSIPFVQVDGDELFPGGGVNYLEGERESAYDRIPSTDEAEITPEMTPDLLVPARTCDDIYYAADLAAYADVTEWTVEVRELVGFGSGGGGDQHRIAGSWMFNIELP